MPVSTGHRLSSRLTPLSRLARGLVPLPFLLALGVAGHAAFPPDGLTLGLLAASLATLVLYGGDALLLRDIWMEDGRLIVSAPGRREAIDLSRVVGADVRAGFLSRRGGVETTVLRLAFADGSARKIRFVRDRGTSRQEVASRILEALPRRFLVSEAQLRDRRV